MWILTTLCAVILQLFRNASSKQLGNHLDDGFVSLARFLPGIPVIAIALCICVNVSGGFALNSGLFYMWASLMGICQVGANMLLISLFKKRNFAGAITLIKTETLMVAIFAITILGETVAGFEWLGIGIATAGLLCAAVAKSVSNLRELLRGLLSLGSLQALGAGGLLALSAIFVKLTFSCVTSNSTLTTVTLSMLVIMSIQTVLLVMYSVVKHPNGMVKIRAHWKNFVLTGILGSATTLFWFLSFSLTNLSNVRTLGQTEFLFSVIVSIVLFKERPLILEIVGMIAVTAGTLILVLH